MSLPKEPEKLNPAQKEAVEHLSGPILISAGAGSGKTKVLIHRIARLIASGIKPENILAVTFTNKAAGEMKKRVSNLLSDTDPEKRKHFIQPANSPWIGTFHSLGAWILRREAKEVGFTKNFSILDEDDSLSLLKESARDLQLDPKQFQPSRIKKIISAKKCDLLNPDDMTEESGNYFSKRLASLWELYEQKLKSSNSLDFDDLLVKTALLFSSNAEVLRVYQNFWQHILIDEYQDTDHVQHRLATMLAHKHSNICVVGDIDQSIYSFRGADLRNILNFEATYPEAKIIALEENYRSTEQILKSANAVIAKNKQRLPKNLFTKTKGGEKLAIYGAENENYEAGFIAETAKNLISKGVKPQEIAVLFRTNAQSRVLEEYFLAQNLPYRVVGVKFYNRKEIKDVLAYIKTALNPDDILSKKRIINQPSRGIGKTLSAKYISGHELKPNEIEKTNVFENIIGKIKSSADKLPASGAVASALKYSEYSSLFDVSSEEGSARLGNIKELVSLSKKFDGLKPPEGLIKMLEEASLMSEQDAIDSKKNGVSLTTVHAAKGLEYSHVFISGLEDGLFPHTAFGGEDEKLRMEEERRLFYVALTRARKKIFLSLAFFRTVFGEKQANMPSRFLEDIPPELLEHGEPVISLEC